MVGCSYHGCDLPCEPCEEHQDRVWAHTAAVQRNPSNYQQRLQAGKWRPQSSSRTSGTLDTLPHLLRSVTSLPVTAVVRQRVRLRIRPCMPICSEANVVATKWRLMTAATRLVAKSVCNVAHLQNLPFLNTFHFDLSKWFLVKTLMFFFEEKPRSNV